MKTPFNQYCAVVIFGAWIICKHRNVCVFDRMTPNLQQAVQAFKNEVHAWQFAGAKRLSTLYLVLRVVHC